MSFLSKLFPQMSDEGRSEVADTESVRRIVAKLEALDPDEARFLAAFAYILGRVAHADMEISAEESAEMERLVREKSGLSEDEALLVVEIAKSQNRLFGGTENFLVTREFAEIASRDQKLELIDCLFAVSAADLSVSVVEEDQIRRVSNELGLTPKEYIEVRLRYSDYRAVKQGLREPSGGDSDGDQT